MPALVVPCPHCAKPSQVDPAKLPDQRVFFACPHCTGRVVVDKRELAEPPQAAAPSATEPVAAPPASPTPPAVEPTVPDRRFCKVPADAIFPSGIIVGDDEATVEQVRDALAALGSEVEHIDSAEPARQMIVNEQPELCIFVAGKIEAAPHPELAPLTGLHPGMRRRLYLMLIADNVKTFDGNAAFMHEVNMVLGKQDVPRIGPALYSGIEYHKRLYRAFLEAAEQKGSI